MKTILATLAIMTATTSAMADNRDDRNARRPHHRASDGSFSGDYLQTAPRHGNMKEPGRYYSKELGRMVYCEPGLVINRVVVRERRCW